MKVASFSDIEEEFQKRVAGIVWCTAATIDRKGRPRSRILHPIWEGSTGWIATGRTTFKARHIEKNPYVSLAYWDQQHEQVYADCRAEWEEDPAAKQRIWDLLKDTPMPVGYDPGLFWKSPQDPSYGVLKLTPWRIEVWSLQEMMQGKPQTVWRPPSQ